MAVIGIWNLFLPLVICGGITGIILAVGFVVFAIGREDHDRPLIPWGARMRVERAKANLELDAIEVKRLAVEHQRTRVLQAIESGDNEAVQILGLPSANGRTETASYR